VRTASATSAAGRPDGHGTCRTDAEAILRVWHERQIDQHLAQLAEARDQSGGSAGQRLQAVLEQYALMTYRTRRHGDTEIVAFLHQDEHLVHARRQLHDLISQLIVDGIRSSEVRGDMTPDELAIYCLHALGGSSSLPSEAAVRRLVSLTMTGLRPVR